MALIFSYVIRNWFKRSVEPINLNGEPNTTDKSVLAVPIVRKVMSGNSRRNERIWQLYIKEFNAVLGLRSGDLGFQEGFKWPCGTLKPKGDRKDV